MAIRSKLMLCAKDIIADDTKSGVTAYNIFDNILTFSFPLIFTSVGVLNLLEKDEDDHEEQQCTLSVVLNDMLVAKLNFKVIFTGSNYARSIAMINGFRLPHAGELSFSLSINGKELDKYTISVIEIDAENQDTPPSIDTTEADSPSSMGVE